MSKIDEILTGLDLYNLLSYDYRILDCREVPDLGCRLFSSSPVPFAFQPDLSLDTVRAFEHQVSSEMGSPEQPDRVIVLTDSGSAAQFAQLHPNLIHFYRSLWSPPGRPKSGAPLISHVSEPYAQLVSEYPFLFSNHPTFSALPSLSWPNRIRQHLFLGSASSRSPAVLQALGITHVVEALEDHLSPSDAHEKRLSIEILRCPIADAEDTDIASFFSPVVAFIRKALLQSQSDAAPSSSLDTNAHAATPRVLVHCSRGASRSATLMAAYLMASEGISSQDAIEDLKKQRPCVNPNAGFQFQLIQWENQLILSDDDN